MNDASILKKTVYMVLAMLAASIVFVGTLSIVAVTVANRAVGGSSSSESITTVTTSTVKPADAPSVKKALAPSKDGAGARPASGERI